VARCVLRGSLRFRGEPPVSPVLRTLRMGIVGGRRLGMRIGGGLCLREKDGGRERRRGIRHGRRRRTPRRGPDRGDGRRGMDPGYGDLRFARAPFRDDEGGGARRGEAGLRRVPSRGSGVPPSASLRSAPPPHFAGWRTGGGAGGRLSSTPRSGGGGGVAKRRRRGGGGGRDGDGDDGGDGGDGGSGGEASSRPTALILRRVSSVIRNCPLCVMNPRVHDDGWRLFRR